MYCTVYTEGPIPSTKYQGHRERLKVAKHNINITWHHRTFSRFGVLGCISPSKAIHLYQSTRSPRFNFRKESSLLLINLPVRIWIMPKIMYDGMCTTLQPEKKLHPPPPKIDSTPSLGEQTSWIGYLGGLMFLVPIRMEVHTISSFLCFPLLSFVNFTKREIQGMR